MRLSPSNFRSSQAIALTLALALGACQRAAPVAEPQVIVDVPTSAGQGGALSGGPINPAPAAPKAHVLDGKDWPAAELVSGSARISCTLAAGQSPVDAQRADLSYAGAQQGAPLADLSYAGVTAALEPCKSTGEVRLRYDGKIATDFTTLVERVSNIAERMQIERRLLDLNSSGGHVEDAMKAGDVIGESRWTIRVGETDLCHSACVLILAAGDDRQVLGKVGIHRMIRVASTATTRAELSQELREVYEQMKGYLERNGASVAVADLMMTVPNRKLRLLTGDELAEYGLDGANAVQDDLERIRLTRKCGEDFVRRKDDFTREYDRQCQLPELAADATEACATALRERYGFPDSKCPVESPVATRAAPITATAAGTSGNAAGE